MNNSFKSVEEAFVSLSGSTQAVALTMTKLEAPLFNIAATAYRMSLFLERLNGKTPHAWFFLEEVSD